MSNVQEIRARQGRLIMIGTEGDTQLAELTPDLILLPKADENLLPLLCTIPAQLLAYEIAARRGCDVDQPRNLAKSVTGCANDGAMCGFEFQSKQPMNYKEQEWIKVKGKLKTYEQGTFT